MSNSTPNQIFKFLTTNPISKKIKISSISPKRYSQKYILPASDTINGRRISFTCKGKSIIGQLILSVPGRKSHPNEFGYLNTRLIEDLLTENELLLVNRSRSLRIDYLSFERLRELILEIINRLC